MSPISGSWTLSSPLVRYSCFIPAHVRWVQAVTRPGVYDSKRFEVNDLKRQGKIIDPPASTLRDKKSSNSSVWGNILLKYQATPAKRSQLASKLVDNFKGMERACLSFSHSNGLTSSVDELLATLFVLYLNLRPHLVISNTK